MQQLQYLDSLQRQLPLVLQVLVLLLPHGLQLGGHLHLALALGGLGRSREPRRVLRPQGVEGCAAVTYLRHFVLETHDQYYSTATSYRVNLIYSSNVCNQLLKYNNFKNGTNIEIVRKVF